jgi:hypothetical protein
VLITVKDVHGSNVFVEAFLPTNEGKIADPDTIRKSYGEYFKIFIINI